MSNTENKKLSREEIAKIEIGHTEVTSAQKYVTTLIFLLMISVYPVLQCMYHPPFREWRKAETTQKAIKAYETAVEETSLLRKWILSPVQSFLTSSFNLGNEKVIIGKNGWLFFSGDYEYSVNPGFLQKERLQKRRLSGVQPDPIAAIRHFNRQLKNRGIKLILLPVPSKQVIYPDMLSASAAKPLQNHSWNLFLETVRRQGIDIIDLTQELYQMRKKNIEPYLKTDTHWTPAGMNLAAEKLYISITGKIYVPKKTVLQKQTVISTGDIAAMLNLPDIRKKFPAEKVGIMPAQTNFDRNSPVLLLGDSFTNIYSMEGMNWGARSGLGETLSAKLGYPVDVLVRNDAAAFASRQLLAQELKKGRDRLAGKKFVIWEFAARELATGNWKLLDMTPGKASSESKWLALTSPQNVETVILSASDVPLPHSAPYKDHVMSLLLQLEKTGEQVLVYTISMKNNVWQRAAKLRPGDKIRIRLSPWSAFEKKYGGWNRSEFTDEELLTAEPCWGDFPEENKGVHP